MKPPVIKTKKFILRPYEASDFEALGTYFNNAKILERVASEMRRYTFADARHWIKKMQKHYTLRSPEDFVWVIEINGALAGAVGLHHIERNFKAELGYWLGEPFWGNGIMTAVVKKIVPVAFKLFKLKRLYAKVLSSNPASQKVLQKAGFAFEGRLKKNVKRRGKIYDDLIFAIIR